MECGKLTAKLRDAVPVCFIENGKEVKRFKNIEIPDEIKKLTYQDFELSVPLTGAITFKIMLEEGILPKDWPEARTRKSRKVSPEEAPMPEKITAGLQAALAQAEAEGQPVAEIAEAAAQGAEITTELNGQELTITAHELETMEAAFNVTGERRKALVKDVKKKGEDAKVAVRNVRRDGNDFLKKLGKEDVSEDEIKELEDQLQKLTDKFGKDIDKLVEAKSKEIMTV